MKWHDKLFVSDNLIKKKDRIIKKISNGRSISEVYCICITDNNNALLEMFESKELIKPYYRSKQYIILGIAKGEPEALDLIRDIIEEVFINTKDVKIREYLGYDYGKLG